VTAEFIDSIAMSDPLLKIMVEKSRIMTAYLKTDVIPKEVKKHVDGG